MSFFRNRGHDVHLISFAKLEAEHIEALTALGIKLHAPIGGFHVKRWWLTIHDLRHLRRTLRREKIDILHAHYLGANAWYAALSGFKPLVLTIMGGGDVTGPDWQPRGKRERLLTPYALRRADVVTSWSKVMADVVKPYCRPDVPVETIHGGVDLTRFHPGPTVRDLRDRLGLRPEDKVIFSARLMRPLSNITTIARAAEFVCKEVPEAVFVFTAPGEQREAKYENEVKDILAANGLQDRARFVNAIPHDEIADYYRLGAVTVLIPGTDGTPLTALESMACGTPVVCGDIPDYDAKYFEHGKTVMMANVADAAAVANAIVTVLKHDELAANLASEARARVVELGSYESQMSRVEQLYQGLMQ
jgi:glycosyltransferase involved in cell wall biosynthesis